MKKALFTSVSALALLAAASDSHAAMASITASSNSWSVFVFEASNASGNLITNGAYRLVIDTTGDGVIDPAINNSETWVWDADDILLDTGIIGGENDPGNFYPFYSGTRPVGIDASDSLYIIWIDKPFGSAKPTANVAYGYQEIGIVGDPDKEYDFYPSAGSAAYVTVPEPASLTVLAIGALGLIARRRKA